MDNGLTPGENLAFDGVIQGCLSFFRCIFFDGRPHLFALQVLDNGHRKGYTAYNNGIAVFRGPLRVFDAVDGEIDLLSGGPLGYGWFTNRPPNFIEPADRLVSHYKKEKTLFRRECKGDIAFYESVTLVGGSYDQQSLGQSIQRYAPRDPEDFYGLANWDRALPYNLK
ncbi:hypothetical protein F5Y03DRAFT_393705 [Xylaria venustula]|nr:hypothetical protein F5Y03DRAFT_393705 [Xylaria venustula]